MATYRYSDEGPVPIAAATLRMVTVPRSAASASAMPMDAISLRLCSGIGPRPGRSGRVQMLRPVSLFSVIANTVLSELDSQYSER